jgi:cysteine sulfinate desulfinase/cysteine desulfurase-like protein
MMMALDDRGFPLGAGSLCSGRPEDPSPVLAACGFPATPGFRVGLGADADQRVTDAFVDTLAELSEDLRAVETASRSALARFRPPDPATG